jgi:hypothetical protein
MGSQQLQRVLTRGSLKEAMKDICQEYELLCEKYLAGAMPVEEFQTVYLDRFKNEQRSLDEALYELLEGIFGDVDSFTTDQELLAENSGFYLDELQLREKVRQASIRLVELTR